jgi:hypothetical protein
MTHLSQYRQCLELLWTSTLHAWQYDSCVPYCGDRLKSFHATASSTGSVMHVEYVAATSTIVIMMNAAVHIGIE